ncbi:glutamine--fructose-6-phosphate transaminase (isomerizing) [Candidatus Marinamargulisbacteria bacterium SCGC AG-343-D04]|nr:glutamine--fructose-6-phosphate transaminase (isomerizing) [Candidatus Marinamargulisbacteria bacterium SCGC AG-343-D04]
MCGIIGYIGDRDISSVLLVGLERLSYRGYDSSGIAVISSNELSIWKKAGKIQELSRILSGMTIHSNIGIGHTRWATHGVPNDINSHPHLDSSKKFCIVHNGIIENYLELKNELINDGVLFRSQTDTEVISHLISKYYTDSVEEAFQKTIQRLKGSFALSLISEYLPDQILFVRKGSPLIVGLGKNENFISSDINAILNHTKEVIYLEDGHYGSLSQTSLTVFSEKGKKVTPKISSINWNPEDSEKQPYDHYMLKEIHEQPHVVRKIISKYVSNDNKINFTHLNGLDLSNISRFIIQACGTSWHAGLIGKYLIEQYANVVAEVDISSEFRYRRMISHGNDVVLAISQSGETADTLAGIHEAKSHFFPVLSFVNVKNSTIDRESDGVVYSHSGQEIGVASTKNFTAQLTSIYLFSIFLARVKNVMTPEEADKHLNELKKIPEYIENILNQAEKFKKLADKYYLSNQILFIGRGMNYPSSLEGALKLKEISYIHATGYAAGELKHGPIALIDSKLPVVCIAPDTSTYDKMLSNIQEVKSRKGKTIIIATEGNKEIKQYADDIIYIPKTTEDLTPLLVSIPLQLFSYYVALNLDCDVDQPRNLAKSVTVE